MQNDEHSHGIGVSQNIFAPVEYETVIIRRLLVPQLENSAFQIIFAQKVLPLSQHASINRIGRKAKICRARGIGNTVPYRLPLTTEKPQQCASQRAENMEFIPEKQNLAVRHT